MLSLPTDPLLSRAIIEGNFRDCCDEVIKIISLASFGAIIYKKQKDEKLKNESEV